MTHPPAVPKPADPGREEPSAAAPPAPLRAQAAAVGGIALAGAGIGALLAWEPFDPALLAVLFLVVSAGAAALPWLRREKGARDAASRLRAQVEAYGGGFYGVAGLSTWLYLEALALRDAWAAADGVRGFVTGRSLEWLVGFGVDSLLNAVRGLLWPLHWGTTAGWLPTAAAAGAAWAVHRLVGRAVPVPALPTGPPAALPPSGPDAAPRPPAERR